MTNKWKRTATKTWERTTINKMKKEDPEREVKDLRSWFRYRGDYLLWGRVTKVTAGEAVRIMEDWRTGTGYYLTYDLLWDQS